MATVAAPRGRSHVRRSLRLPAPGERPQPDLPALSVVCGIDRSDAATEVACVAAEISALLEARLVLVHVAPFPAVPGSAAVPGAADELRELEIERARDLLAGHPEGAPEAANVERRVAFGAPASALDEVACEERARVIVVGSRGRRPLLSAFGGSVSSQLTRNAPCPVLVVGPRSRCSLRPPGEPVAGSGRQGGTE
jgi:nucleotide-binding universal stress UspA family protein